MHFNNRKGKYSQTHKQTHTHTRYNIFLICKKINSKEILHKNINIPIYIFIYIYSSVHIYIYSTYTSLGYEKHKLMSFVKKVNVSSAQHKDKRINKRNKKKKLKL